MSPATEAAADRRNWSDPKAQCEGREPWHGTRTGYGHHGCRGDACREAAVAYNRLLRFGHAQYHRPGVATLRGDRTPNPIFSPDTYTRLELLEARGLSPSAA